MTSPGETNLEELSSFLASTTQSFGTSEQLTGLELNQELKLQGGTSPLFVINIPDSDPQETLPIDPATVIPSASHVNDRSQSCVNSASLDKGLLDDHLPPRSRTVVACSCQNILATALEPRLFSKDYQTANSVTIAFSLLPFDGEPTPSWLFTLPLPSLSPTKDDLSPQASYNSTRPAAIDQLLFSSDGTHLLICSHTSSSQDALGHLRLSILVQGNGQADEWRMAWDEVIYDSIVSDVHHSVLLEHPTKRVMKARFLSHPRRWYTEPALGEVPAPDEDTLVVRGTAFRRLRRTRGSAINSFTQGKGQTAVLVLSTNELLVVHVPLPQIDMPPHVLLTSLNNSTLAKPPLKLTPTPSSLFAKGRRSSTTQGAKLNLVQEQSEPTISHLGREVQQLTSQNIGLGFSLGPSPFPAMNHSTSMFSPATAPANMTGLCLSSLLADPNLVGLELEGESINELNSNARIPYNAHMNSLISNRKEIQIAAIGFPNDKKEPEDQADPGPILIAFQSKLNPIIPPSVRRIVLPSPVDDHKAQVQQEDQRMTGSQFSMGEEDLGNYITGLGDLDDAFDIALGGEGSGNNSNPPPNNVSELSMEEGSKINNKGVAGDKRKFSADFRKQKNKRRRYETVSGTDASGDKTGLGGKRSHGFIELVEVFVDFEDSVIPTVAIQPLPSVPILDPFEHNNDCQVALRTLDFLELEPEPSSSSPRVADIKMLASYVKVKSDGRDDNQTRHINELQCWEARYERSSLSHGFLALECFSDAQHNVVNLQGPEEWVFVRSVTKPLECDQATRLEICNIIPNWRSRVGTFLLFVNRTGAWARTECRVLSACDLAEIDMKPLTPLDNREAQQVNLTHHGVWGCSIDPSGRLRILSLVKAGDNHLITSLVMGAIYNRDSVDDIAYLLGYRSTADQELSFDHRMVFGQISNFIANITTSFKNYEMDPLLPTAWSLGYGLWRACPDHRDAAELALIGRQMTSALTIGMSVKHEAYYRSLWQMIGLSKWYVRLCQKIICSSEPNSPTAHYCLLPTTSCTFFHLFKLAMIINSFWQWLSMMKTSQPGMASPPMGGEAEVARSVFSEIWDQKNPLQMESWGKLLQDLGPGVVPRPGSDLSKLPIRHTEVFSAPLAAADPEQVRDAVDQFKRSLDKQTHLIKPGFTLDPRDENEYDLVTGARLDKADVRQCVRCKSKAMKVVWNPPRNRPDEFGPSEHSARDFQRKCVCWGIWVTGQKSV